MSIPPYTQDLISAFYYARTLDYGSNPAGTQFDLGQYHLDGEITPISLKYLGRETLSTALGKIQCLKLRPILQEGRVFKESEGMSIWVSDDAAHVPIRVQADILVGSIRMDISEATGLIRPLPQK